MICHPSPHSGIPGLNAFPEEKLYCTVLYDRLEIASFSSWHHRARRLGLFNSPFSPLYQDSCHLHFDSTSDAAVAAR